MPTLGDLLSERSRRQLLEQLAELAEQEAAKPREPPPALFQPPPGPGNGDPPTERTAP